MKKRLALGWVSFDILTLCCIQSTNYANPKKPNSFCHKNILVMMINFEQRSYFVTTEYVLLKKIITQKLITLKKLSDNNKI